MGHDTPIRATVLVVEDDSSSGSFVTGVLERGGYRPVWVASAERASERLARIDFDILLTTIQLPGRSALDLLEEQHRARPEMAMAIMTSGSDREIERRAFALGADEFFEKPLEPSCFLDRMDALAERQRRTGRRPIDVAGFRREPPAGRYPRWSSATSPDADADSRWRLGHDGLAAEGFALWASVAPAVSRVASDAGPVFTPATEAASTTGH
jgi:DNA-binding response OmpR family regulator